MLDRVGNVIYFNAKDAQQLTEILQSQNGTCFCERIPEPYSHHLPDVTTDAVFFMRITSGFGFKINLAKMITSRLMQDFRFSPSQFDAVHTALQEAISNALIHGNLGVQGARNNMHDMEKFYECLEMKKKIPELLMRPIDIKANASGDQVSLIVTDYGDGFDWLGILQSYAANNSSKGLSGLQLMINCCQRIRFEDEGRTVVMSFLRGGK